MSNSYLISLLDLFSWIHRQIMGFYIILFPDDKEEEVISERDEEGLDEFNGELMEHEDNELMPVEHLLEPLDEDGPVKCPMFDSFPLMDQSIWKEVVTDGGLQKRKGPFTTARETITQSANKRKHHSIGRDSTAPSPPSKTLHTNFLQVFNQCRDYDF
ncbi:hypothetical protein J5N97_005913 [Dioscorea zingiberensis]|uniref:Uncharacterized protein n=1 Tax=Dioscorea zingiberensis TaxID=325984 RepID=A0A9D5HTI8_9LILI|nr:hypothetical protein J5N97_005913 [Dioscorea zingiberensis]